MSELQVGDYRLLHRIGKGGMGEVWRARRDGLGGASKQVALKLLLEQLRAQPELRAMFLEEARLAMMITHANVVQVFDVDEAAGAPYMVMEWVDGLNLAQLCKRLRSEQRRLPLPLVAYVLGELLKAAMCIHELDAGDEATLVHRDLTPENVMLSVWGEVKLMDFGVARLATDTRPEPYAKGKLAYMPPEQLSGDDCLPTLDMFALGALLHELLDGRPFRGGAPASRLAEIARSGSIPPLRDPARVPRPLERLRSALLERDPSERLDSAREALGRLNAWPDYRDAQLELAELVRRFMPAPERRMEELEELELLDIELLEEGDELEDAELLSASCVEEIDEGLELGASLVAPAPARARPSSDHPPAPTAQSPAPRAPSPAPKRSRRPVWLMLIAATLGAGLALGYRLRPDPPPAPAVFPHAAQDRPLELHPPQWQPWWTRAPPPPAVELADAQDDVPTDPPAQPDAAPVELVLRAPSHAWVELRLGQLRATLGHAREDERWVTLPAGTHAVEFRTWPGSAWRRAGTITLSADLPSSLRLGPNGELSLGAP